MLSVWTGPGKWGSELLRLIGSSNVGAWYVKSSVVCMVAAAMLSARSGAQAAEGATCGVPAPVVDSSSINRHLDRHWSFGAWFAGGTHEPIKTREGHMEDRALYVLGISAARLVSRWRFGEIRFIPTLVPAIVATANREYETVSYNGGGTGILPYKKTAFGAGLLPIAAEAAVHLSDRAGIVVGGGGGAAYFDRRIPDPDETRFNFLADGHTGVYVHSGLGTVTLGFRLQHISNGDTGRVNPGMDTRMLYIGFTR
jgi:lipid A 3-O-deacylase PagL